MCQYRVNVWICVTILHTMDIVNVMYSRNRILTLMVTFLLSGKVSSVLQLSSFPSAIAGTKSFTLICTSDYSGGYIRHWLRNNKPAFYTNKTSSNLCEPQVSDYNIYNQYRGRISFSCDEHDHNVTLKSPYLSYGFVWHCIDYQTKGAVTRSNNFKIDLTTVAEITTKTDIQSLTNIASVTSSVRVQDTDLTMVKRVITTTKTYGELSTHLAALTSSSQVKEEPVFDKGDIMILAAASSVGGVVAVTVVVIVTVIFWKRRKLKKEATPALQNRQSSTDSDLIQDVMVMEYNILYTSSVEITTDIFNDSSVTDIYSKVNKEQKPPKQTRHQLQKTVLQETGDQI